MLRVESLVVKADRVVAVVRMDPGAPTHTTPELARRVAAAFPDVPGHACVNALGPRFSDVMDHTSIPHLLEHLVIDLQADAYTRARASCPAATTSARDVGAAADGQAGAPSMIGSADGGVIALVRAQDAAPVAGARGVGAAAADCAGVPLLVGVTKWIDRSQGLAQVQVAFFDDLVALAAFRDAASFLNKLA